jgi:hypothetical protein
MRNKQQKKMLEIFKVFLKFFITHLRLEIHDF